jgi:hypothetical protein
MDKIFKGFDGALVGTFSIPIGDILAKQRRENIQDMLDLDNIIITLEKILEGVGVMTYESIRSDMKDESKDKDFKAQVQKDKAAQEKAMNHKKAPSLTNKVLPSILQPEKKKDIEDDIKDKKQKSMRKRLLSGTDDDSDEDGNEYSNPVAKAPDTAYKPPPLNINTSFEE